MNTGLFQRSQNTDMGKAAGAAAAEGQTKFWTRRGTLERGSQVLQEIAYPANARRGGFVFSISFFRCGLHLCAEYRLWPVLAGACHQKTGKDLIVVNCNADCARPDMGADHRAQVN